jgi:ubiquinone/menaquinone biosynthesis C-methylase UbiE
MVPRLTAVEIDSELAAMLSERFAENQRVTVAVGDATQLAFPDDRFTGAASFTMLHHIDTETLQDRLFAEVARVLKPTGVFVAGDSLASAELAAHHEDDTYNPIDPTSLVDRLHGAGFVAAQVKTNEYGWAAVARKP